MPKNSKPRRVKGERGHQLTFERGEPTRKLNRKVLIACEGAETEVQYFKALCRHRRLSAAEVVLHGPEGGTDPKSIVEFAKEKVDEADRDGEPFDEVWCVFDRDDHLKVAEAMNQAEHQSSPAEGFGVAFSNPCFELWFLLHFEYSTAHRHRSKVVSALKRKDRLGAYGKSMKGVYDVLLDRQPTAIENAGKLRMYHQDANEGRPENPCTKVDELVARLNALADEAKRSCALTRGTG